MTIWRMRIARWVFKATNTHSQYVILIAFPLQQWLYEHCSVLRCTYVASLFITETESVYCSVRTEPVNKLMLISPSQFILYRMENIMPFSFRGL